MPVDIQSHDMRCLHEALHVFNSHTANMLFFIEGEENEYSHEELVNIIRDAREEIKEFNIKWLTPIIKELEERRKYDILTEANT